MGEAHDRLLLWGQPGPPLNIFCRKWRPGGPWKALVTPTPSSTMQPLALSHSICTVLWGMKVIEEEERG